MEIAHADLLVWGRALLEPGPACQRGCGAAGSGTRRKTGGERRESANVTPLRRGRHKQKKKVAQGDGGGGRRPQHVEAVDAERGEHEGEDHGADQEAEDAEGEKPPRIERKPSRGWMWAVPFSSSGLIRLSMPLITTVPKSSIPTHCQVDAPVRKR